MATMILFTMTDWQRKVVEAVIKQGDYAGAAQFLNKEVGAVKAVFFKLRSMDRKATDYHEQILKYQRQLGPKKKYLIT